MLKSQKKKKLALPIFMRQTNVITKHNNTTFTVSFWVDPGFYCDYAHRHNINKHLSFGSPSVGITILKKKKEKYEYLTTGQGKPSSSKRVLI